MKRKKRHYRFFAVFTGLAALCLVFLFKTDINVENNFGMVKAIENRIDELRATVDFDAMRWFNNIENVDDVEVKVLPKCVRYNYLATDSLILNPQYRGIQEVLYQKMGLYTIQGTVLVGVGDELVYVESFGKASEKKNINNTNTTRYGIASLSKSFTAAAIMQLYEEGLLDLNDTLEKYFPEYEYGKDITILDLLQMRSGIVDYLNDMKNYMTVSDSKAIYDSFVKRKDLKGLDEYKWSREDMLKNLYNNEVKYEHGEKYSYSNTNYYILGCIIEQLSGMDYETYVTEKFFKPCYMESSNLAPRDGDAVGYLKTEGEGYVLSSYETLFSVGAIRSNVFDLFSWIRNLTKGNVVSKESFYKMIDVRDVAIKDQIAYEKEQQEQREKLGNKYVEPEVEPDVIPTYYACGLKVTGNKVWHTGYIDGFANYMFTDLSNGVTIIILTNAGEKRAIKNFSRLWQEVENAVEKVLEEKKAEG